MRLRQVIRQRVRALMADRCKCGGHWVNTAGFMVLPMVLACDRCGKAKPSDIVVGSVKWQELQAANFLHGI